MLLPVFVCLYFIIYLINLNLIKSCFHSVCRRYTYASSVSNTSRVLNSSVDIRLVEKFCIRAMLWLSQNVLKFWSKNILSLKRMGLFYMSGHNRMRIIETLLDVWSAFFFLKTCYCRHMNDNCLAIATLKIKLVLLLTCWSTHLRIMWITWVVNNFFNIVPLMVKRFRLTFDAYFILVFCFFYSLGH